jgi:uridine kinase
VTAPAARDLPEVFDGDFAALAGRVLAAAPRLGAVRVVAVDGPAGSGKTTFAGRLATALQDQLVEEPRVGRVCVVHMDDLYAGWEGLDAEVHDRLAAQVLAPLAAGQPGRYQRYDWHAGRFGDWVDVPVPAVLIVEGVGSAAGSVDRSLVLRVWVEVPAELRMRRGVARDGEALRGEWERWAVREQRHFAADGTRERADLMVDGSAADAR